MIKRVELLNKGQKIKGVLYLRKKAPLVIICHGFTRNKDFGPIVFLSKFLYSNGYSVLRFDFRGSGKSEGEFTSISEQVSDLKKIVNFAKRNSKKIILLGHSLGGATIIMSKIKSRGVILINPALSAELIAFTFLRKMIPLFFIHKILNKIDIFSDKTFEHLETAGRLIKGNFRFRISENTIEKESRKISVRKIRDIHAPIFFVQSQKDGLTNPKGTKQAFELAHNPKSFFLVEGADHTMGLYRHKLLISKKIIGWLNENGLKGSAKK